MFLFPVRTAIIKKWKYVLSLKDKIGAPFLPTLSPFQHKRLKQCMEKVNYSCLQFWGYGIPLNFLFNSYGKTNAILKEPYKLYHLSELQLGLNWTSRFDKFFARSLIITSIVSIHTIPYQQNQTFPILKVSICQAGFLSHGYSLIHIKALEIKLGLDHYLKG